MKKLCIVMQSQYAKIGHAFAVHLKERYGVAEFSAYVFSLGAAEFLRGQRDIAYAPMLVDHELHEGLNAGPTDREYIARFEETYGPDAHGPNLWQYLWCDRKLMMSMGPKEETTTVLDPLYDHDRLMRAFQVRAKAIEAMLKNDRPDALFFFAIGTLGHRILYHVAQTLGIPCYNIDFPRVANRMCISKDYRTLSTVEDAFRTFQKENIQTPFHDEAKKLLDQFRTTGSLNLQYMDIAVGVLPKKGQLFNPEKFKRSVSYLITLSKNYWKNRRLFVYGMTDANPIRFIGHKIKQRYRMMRGVEDLYTPTDWSENFAYFPLHYEPELSILLLSPFYFDQIELIKYIARSLPLEYKLYVKEHPAMVSKRARSYYKKLLKIPNVRLIHHKTPGFEILKHAKLVTAITGTTGWEAGLVGVPVVSFGEVFYNALSFVKRVHNIEELPQVIRQQLFHFHYDEKEMADFVAAVLAESVPFDFSKLWYENDIPKLKENAGLQTFAALMMRHARKTG